MLNIFFETNQMLKIIIFCFSSVQHRRENGKMNSEDEIMESEDEFDEGKFLCV